MRAALAFACLLLAACAREAGTSATTRVADAGAEPQAPPPQAVPPPGAVRGTGHAPPRVPPDPVLARMLGAIAPYGAYQQPCIAKEPMRAEFTPEQNRRGKVIWSDSLELQRRIRAAHGDRILLMTPDVSRGAADARFLVRVTGNEPLPAYRLGGRVRDVPVLVEYGAPFSAEELRAKAQAATPALRRLLPDAQGWGVAEGWGLGALMVDVYSPPGQPPADLTRLCEQLVAAAGMPVLLRYSNARMMQGPAPASPVDADDRRR